MKGITLETIHYAHIRITTRGSKGGSYYEVEEIEAITHPILNELYIEGEGRIPNVGINPEFCCNALTEVGLYGHDWLTVKKAAFEIARVIDTHPLYKLFD
jgi:hypothetical protein